MQQKIIEDVTGLRAALHEIPEPAFKEEKTRETLKGFLKKLEGIDLVDRGEWFYAVYHGKRRDDAIAFRADFDALEGKDGVCGHFCGHDGHASILAGFAEYVGLVRPERTVYFIFQPAEEIGKGAVLARKLLEEEKISEIYGFHNIPGYPLNSVLILKDTFACASTGLEITITGTPSHAAYPEAGKNPAEVIARLILLKDEILKENYQGLVLATVIGAEIGSKAYGVSASTGTLRLTVRAAVQEDFDRLIRRFEERAESLAKEKEMTCSITRIEEFPATVNHGENIEKLIRAAEQTGKQVIFPPEPFRWSEDFGYYLMDHKGAFFGIGDGEGYPQLHTEGFVFPDAIMETVLDLYAKLIEG